MASLNGEGLVAGGAAKPSQVFCLATEHPPIAPKTDPAQDKFRKPRAVAANKPAAGRRVRLQYLTRRLHGLGERPLFHFLDEVERGADLRPHLERYAALPAAFIKANGGDKFPPSFLHVIDGGKP